MPLVDRLVILGVNASHQSNQKIAYMEKKSTGEKKKIKILGKSDVDTNPLLQADRLV